jgi:hypothetical protein
MRFLLLIFVIGCSSSPYKKKSNDPYEVAVFDALKELELESEKIKRGVASVEPQNKFMKKAIGFKLKSIKRFKMLVFPANPNFNKKVDIGSLSGIDYASPMIFNFKTILSNSCKKLSKMRKYNARLYFVASEIDMKKKCLVVEGRQKRPKKWGKMVTRLKRDTTLAVRVYIDEDFRPFGKEVDIAVGMGKKAFKTVRLKMDVGQNLSSELSFFPIDLPNFKNPINGNRLNYKSEGAVRIPKDLFVLAQVKKYSKRKVCKSGYQLDMKNFLGEKVMIDFCAGSSWPFAIHTNSFFAILI